MRLVVRLRHVGVMATAVGALGAAAPEATPGETARTEIEPPLAGIGAIAATRTARSMDLGGSVGSASSPDTIATLADFAWLEG